MGVHGNRGKCAQPCRLPYELFKTNNNTAKSLEKGYLLSPRDLCGLDYIEDLIKAGVSSFKIEGRMKSPEYVATVTKIYSEQIQNCILQTNSQKDYKKELMQVFNRGGFSSGHLQTNPNQNLVFKEKPNNMGLYLGKVMKYNKNKGYITLKLIEDLEIGDTISLEKESGKYNVSELMINNKNSSSASALTTVTIGRMQGNIHLGDKIYKMSSKTLSKIALDSFSKENKKINLECSLKIKQGEPIFMSISSKDNFRKL